MEYIWTRYGLSGFDEGEGLLLEDFTLLWQQVCLDLKGEVSAIFLFIPGWSRCTQWR